MVQELAQYTGTVGPVYQVHFTSVVVIGATINYSISWYIWDQIVESGMYY